MVVNDTIRKKKVCLTFVLILYMFWSKTVYKPVSVISSYPSRTNITISFKQPTQTLNWSLTSLFGLAPGGVYLAINVAINAVGSYSTISPLPLRRYIFCGTFPKVSLAGYYPAPLLLETGLSSFI